MRRLITRRRLLVVLCLFAVLAVVFVIKWKSVSDHGGQSPVEPFRIARRAGDAIELLIEERR